jgi:hypothetical protein
MSAPEGMLYLYDSVFDTGNSVARLARPRRRYRELLG